MLDKRDAIERFFSISEAAEQLEVSPSTLRKWEDTMGGTLPRRIMGTGGQRVYTQADIDVLRKVSELRDQGLTPEQIGIFLSKFPIQTERSESINYTFDREVLQEVVQEVTRQVTAYVDEKANVITEKVDSSVDRMYDRLVEERDRETMAIVRALLDEKQERLKKRSWWDKFRGN